MGDPFMSRGERRVIVVGGGVIGASCAYYLARSGWSVTVLDAGRFGMGCSHANCGLVTPSHVMPLAVPGATRDALKALIRPNGPLKIRPRLDPALWAWLLRFYRRCSRADMMESARAIQALLNSSRSLYDQLMKEEPFDCEWHTHGLLFVFRDPKALEHHGEAARLLRDQFGVNVRQIDSAELSSLEPALRPGLAGAWLYQCDAHLRPDRLMDSWHRILDAKGVAIRENCPAQDLVRANGRAQAVATPEGAMEADTMIFATGAWTPLLAPQLGHKVPIQPGKGYSITMPCPAHCPVYPLIFEEHRVAVTPWKSGYRLGSTMEFAGYDATLNRRRLELLREGARHYLLEPYTDPVQEEWFGWRPMTPDSRPIIDRAPGLDNVWIAAGHNMLGVSMSPATGKLVAELLDARPPHIDPAPYAIHRF
jgi:D-amino-acid dehydrogenase